MNVSLGTRATTSKLRETLVPVLTSMIGTLIVLFPSNPSNMTLPSRDSGVFLYVAWRFLNSDIPYRDVWDHKPPLIYFVDAVGEALTPKTMWGVWVLQVIFIFLTLLLLYKLLDNLFGVYAAMAGLITMTSGLLTLLENGNVTEEYALVFQLLGLWLYIRAWKKGFPLLDSFWIGIIGGVAFHFKQTTIGVFLSYGLIVFVNRLLQRRSPVPDILSVLAGVLVPTVFWVVYFASQNALTDYWQQAFLYNFIYIGKHEGIRRIIPVFWKGFLLLRQGWVLYLAALGWLFGVGYLWLMRKRWFLDANPLILLAVIDLLLEVVLITTSGHSIIHYYLTPLPVMAILTGTLIYTVPLLLGKLPRLSSEKIQMWGSAFVLAVVVTGQVGQVMNYPEYVRVMKENTYAPVIAYVRENTNKDDKLLIIGAESVVNYLARRAAPTRYVYQYPLALLGNRGMFEEYFNEILENKPALIIDTRGRTQLAEKLYVPLQKRSQIVRDGVQYLADNYQQVAQFGDWFVYRLAEH